MKMMKRLLAMLMMLCMLAPVCVFAEEEAPADPFSDTIVIDTEDVQSAEDEVYIPEEDEELASAIDILDEEIDDTVDP